MLPFVDKFGFFGAPAKAGIQKNRVHACRLDSCLAVSNHSEQHGEYAENKVVIHIQKCQSALFFTRRDVC